MKNKWINILFKVLIIFFLVIILILIINIKNLKNEIKLLNESLENLKGDYFNLEGDYLNLRKETTSLLQDIDAYQNEIQESLEWYKKNSILNDHKSQAEIRANCLKIDGDECRIKLGCFYFINSEKLNLEYQYDESTYEEDKLSSIEDFLINEGGDCEDYSLFFKAEYNYALSQCNGKEVILEGWRPPKLEEKDSTYWLNFQESWYLDDVVKIEITENIFPNIICGNLYDPILGDISGHCMIAFTKNKIQSLDQLSELYGAYIIEPQDGSFFGNINDMNSEIYLLDEEIWYDNAVNSCIYSVITDADYFLFSEESLDWNSYYFFDALLETKKEQINNSLNKTENPN